MQVANLWGMIIIDLSAFRNIINNKSSKVEIFWEKYNNNDGDVSNKDNNGDMSWAGVTVGINEWMTDMMGIDKDRQNFKHSLAPWSANSRLNAPFMFFYPWEDTFADWGTE